MKGSRTENKKPLHIVSAWCDMRKKISLKAKRFSINCKLNVYISKIVEI